MSGWIKIEKALETDPRVLRMAKELDRRLLLFTTGTDLDPCNASALPGVTLVCGALTRLWMYADSHIREDDTLDLGVRELDEWLGIDGFCATMPDDWLREIDDRTVELPGFQEHNGVEARRRALTQKRVATHRAREKHTVVTPRNAPALPDQTRPDLDQTRPIQAHAPAKTREAKARGSSRCPGDFEVTEALRAIAAELPPDFDLDAETRKFRDFEFKQPRKDWPACWRTWMRNARDRGGYAKRAQSVTPFRLRTPEEIEADEARRASR